MTINTKKKTSAFTLVEVLVYLGIISIVLVSLVYLSLMISDAQEKNKVMQEVNNNMRLIINRVSYEARRAVDLDIPNPQILQLDSPGVDDISLIFEGNSFKIKRGANDWESLSSSFVQVTGSFEDLSYSQGGEELSKNFQLNITVSYLNPQNLSIYSYSRQQQLSIELRNW